jgi:PEP-CTERM motif
MLLVVALAYLPAVNAALLFEDFNPGVIGAPGSQTGTFGTQFTVGPQSLSVTKLGTFAVASADMSVAIWQVSGVNSPLRVGFAEVPSIGGTVLQGWNFTNVTPFTLLANTVYRIGAETETATVAWPTRYTPGSGIASVASGYYWAPPPGFEYPSQSVTGLSLFAANAEIAPIPEPSSYALLLAGLAWLCFVYRRRQNDVRVTIR